ncbi:MAG: DUF1501 domain-containing protein, partial [Bacillota bacterium]
MNSQPSSKTTAPLQAQGSIPGSPSQLRIDNCQFSIVNQAPNSSFRHPTSPQSPVNSSPNTPLRRPTPKHACGFADQPVSRRRLLRTTLAGAASLLITDRRAPAALPTTRPAKAKAVIQIWLWGGPSHLDTFDPKPDAGPDYTGPLNKPIPTNVPGIQIGELLPRLAKQADKYSIIRSMTHGVTAHETAAYMVQTGRMPGDRLVYPSVGAVVSVFKGYDAGYRGLIPPYVVLTELQGRFSEAGFLGTRYKPFATGGDPAQSRFAVEGVVAASISDQRQKDRRELLHNLNTLHHALPDDPQLIAAAQCENQAYDLILGDAGKVFDLSQEKADLRDRYGRNTFGQSCL